MEPKRGLFAGGGTTVRLPRQLAFPAAMEFLLTAERFPAERALELGLLNEIVEEDELLERAYAWARRITANAPLAVQATKESVMRGLALSLDEAYALESEISKRVFQSEDAKEGPTGLRREAPPGLEGPVVDPRAPCIIGVAQRTYREQDGESPEPLVAVGGDVPRGGGRQRCGLGARAPSTA